MLLYINGDSHAAGAEALVVHSWAMDDPNLYHLGQRPHPDNESVSFGAKLSELLQVQRINHSMSGCGNQRIRRTTRDWIQQNPDQLSQTFMLIQWSTWEREEWWYQDQYWQVNASGTDHVPRELEQRYKEFVVSVDWTECTQRAHQEIWEFHQELRDLNIAHLMFNANSHFGGLHLVNNLMVPIIAADQRRDWHNQFINPYDQNGTYNAILRQNGFDTVAAGNYHFGKDAHCFWAQFLLQYMKQHQLLDLHEIPTD